MKNLIILKNTFSVIALVSIILTCACCKKKTGVDTLPPATQEGKNTMGYMYDGKPVIVEGVYTAPLTGCHSGVAYIKNGSNFELQGRRCGFPTLTLHIGKPTNYVGEINFNKKPITVLDSYGELDLMFVGELYQTNDSVVGKVTITKASNNIISGTFQFDCINIDTKQTRIKVTDGRFDFTTY
jgi:hypothetical protein